MLEHSRETIVRGITKLGQGAGNTGRLQATESERSEPDKPLREQGGDASAAQTRPGACFRVASLLAHKLL